jgi:cupin fold WbuC family metalloprotein
MIKLAFGNPSGELFTLTDKMIEKGRKASQKSERLRIILPVHRVQEAEVQRMVNFLQPGTYIRPHRHAMPHASESILLLAGAICFFTFDDEGRVRTINEVVSGPVPGLIDIEPKVWHSFLVLEPDTILFECKKGPYDVNTDKEFASWAPPEGSPDVAEWKRSMERHRKEDVLRPVKSFDR